MVTEKKMLEAIVSLADKCGHRRTSIWTYTREGVYLTRFDGHAKWLVPTKKGPVSWPPLLFFNFLVLKKQYHLLLD